MASKLYNTARKFHLLGALFGAYLDYIVCWTAARKRRNAVQSRTPVITAHVVSIVEIQQYGCKRVLFYLLLKYVQSSCKNIFKTCSTSRSCLSKRKGFLEWDKSGDVLGSRLYLRAHSKYATALAETPLKYSLETYRTSQPHKKNAAPEGMD